MNFKKSLLAAAVLLAGTASQATPTPLATCSFSDLIGVTVTKCYGFSSGNLINSSPADVDTVKSILTNTFGVVSPTGNWVEKLDGLGGSHTINFATPLSGPTIVALHFGAGRGGPGNGTAFYEFNAGSNLDSFQTQFNALSNAAVYMTSAVPEPETYAMLLAGLGVMGAVARRRKQSV